MSVRVMPVQYRKDGFETMPFRHLAPLGQQDGNKYPLLVFLHGVGECGSDNESQLWYPFFSDETSVFGGESLSRYQCHLLAPQAPDHNRWVDIQDWGLDKVTLRKEPTASLKMLIKLVQSLVERGDVDPERIYLTGLSMGAFGVYELLAREPRMFAAAVAVCGGADFSTAGLLQQVPMRIYHGDKDKVVPVELSRELFKILKPLGSDVSYHELEHVGHNAWEYAFRDETLFPWLFEQSRKSR